MDFRAGVESFEEADRRYAELARRRDDGSISAEEFDAERQQLMVRDEEGRWWAKLGESGEWRYRDGGDWVEGTPPGYQEVASEEDGDDNLPARGPSSKSGAKGEGKRRRLSLWIPLMGLLGLALMGIVFVFWSLAPSLQSEIMPGSGDEPVSGGQGESEGEQARSEGGFEAIFVHRATPENISANSTYIDDSLTNDNPDAVLIVTQNWNPGAEGGTYNDHSVGVWYNSERGRWAIFNQDREDMTEEAAFNVAVR